MMMVDWTRDFYWCA